MQSLIFNGRVLNEIETTKQESRAFSRISLLKTPFTRTACRVKDLFDPRCGKGKFAIVFRTGEMNDRRIVSSIHMGHLQSFGIS
jgi:hypothetical protein